MDFVLTFNLVQSQASEHSALLHIRLYTCSFEGCLECGPMKLDCCMCGKHYCQSHHRHGCLDPLKKELMDKRAQYESLRLHHENIKESVNRMVSLFSPYEHIWSLNLHFVLNPVLR